MPSERIQRRVDRLLDEIETAQGAGDWQAVQAHAREILDLDPENQDAASFLRAAERRAGATEPAGEPAAPGQSEPPPLPASFGGGRYAVRAFLGEGARKQVYLAHDSRLDRDVAVAVIKTEGLERDGLERVRREAQAMARLGDHPNVVTVFDVGEDPSTGSGQARPFMVLRHMEGGSLEDIIAAAEDRRLPLPAVLRLATEICGGLEQAHQRGIVHRDLKPGNVWLSQGGTASIGDFGLAVALDRSRLTAEGMMVGTAIYVAPEQALGQPPSAASDLYSLGCVLYEMVAGRPPYLGDDAVAVISQHINTAPVSPSWHRPDVPRGLEALILRLLEKDPANRPQSAAEVLQALTAVDLATGVGAQHAAPLQGDVAASPADPIYARTFVGREQELGTLRDSYDAALSGQGGLVMVVGEPGIGKTSVTEQLSTYVAMRGGQTLVGHCYEEGSLSLPYLAFVEALRSYVLAREPEGLRSDLGQGAGDVARIVSEVRDRLNIAPAASTSPDEDRFRLLQAVTAFLRNAAAVQPICLVLEDLHDADRGTLDMLTFVARNLAATRLLVIGTYRDVEVDRAHPLSATLADLRRTERLQRVPLRGLTPDETRRMLSNIARQDVSWPLAEAVHRQTEGNPLFIQEVVRYIAEQGLITRTEGAWRASAGVSLTEVIPEGLRDVIGKRLSRLSQASNAVLAVASVIGREFSLQTLRVVAGLSEEELLVSLEEAVRAAVLDERQQIGDVRYRFAHAFFRQTLYEELIAPRRIRLHQQVAKALEAQYASRIDEHAAELADHFSHSSDPDDLAKAVHYGRVAAARASQVYAYSEAVRLLTHALQVQEVFAPEDRALRCDMLLDLCDALSAADEPTRVERETAEEAFLLADALGDSRSAARAALAALDSLTWIAGPAALTSARAREWGDRASKHAAPMTPVSVRADLILAMRGMVSGVDPGAIWASRVKGLEDARLIGDPDTFHYAAGLTVFDYLGDWESVQYPLIQEVLARADDGAGSRFRAYSNYMIGGAVLREGDREAADECFRAQSALARRAPDSVAAALGLACECIALSLDGSLEEAVARSHQLPGQTGALNVRVAVTLPLVYLGRVPEFLAMSPTVGPWSVYIFMLEGREEEARELLEVLDIDRLGPAPAMLTVAGAILLEDREKVAQLVRRLEDTWRAANQTWPSITDRVLGEAYTFLGEPEEARARFESAIELAQKMRWRPEVALSRFGLAQLLLERSPRERKDALAHLDFALAEFREMKMAPYVEKALRLKLETQGLTSSDLHTSIEAVNSAVQTEHPALAQAAGADGTVTILFTDIAGSASRAEELGDEQWLALIRAHNAIVREQVQAHGGREVANRGDGFMIVFSNPLAAVECAVAIQRAFADKEQGTGNREQGQSSDHVPGSLFPVPIQVHIGLHTGRPAQDEGNFYGTDVNLAARIADHVAQAGQIVVSQRLRDALADQASITFGEPAEVALKGLSGKHRLYEVLWQ